MIRLTKPVGDRPVFIAPQHIASVLPEGADFDGSLVMLVTSLTYTVKETPQQVAFLVSRAMTDDDVNTMGFWYWSTKANAPRWKSDRPNEAAYE